MAAHPNIAIAHHRWILLLLLLYVEDAMIDDGVCCGAMKEAQPSVWKNLELLKRAHGLYPACFARRILLKQSPEGEM